MAYIPARFVDSDGQDLGLGSFVAIRKEQIEKLCAVVQQAREFLPILEVSQDVAAREPNKPKPTAEAIRARVIKLREAVDALAIIESALERVGEQTAKHEPCPEG